MVHPTLAPRGFKLQHAENNGMKTLYADLLGQDGMTTRQLIECPPDGYRVVTRRKLTNAIAEFQHGKPLIRRFKLTVRRFVPINLFTSYCLTRFIPPPTGVDLTYSESSVIFRPEPWVIWLEVATQMVGYDHHQLRRCRKTLERLLGSGNCRAIICHTEACKRSVLAGLNTERFAHKLHVVPSGWPLVSDVAPRGSNGHGVRILFVGASRLSLQFRIKGGWEALEAFAALRQRFPGLELVVRSDVDEEILKTYEGMPGLRILNGLISRAELDALFRGADIFWFPAHTLLSVSVLEAMSYGLPVITTDYYDNPEFVEDGKTGMVIPHHRHLPPWDTSEREVRRALRARDPDFQKTLVETTAMLIENPDLRRRMGRAARAAIESKFSLAEKNRRFKAIFDAATTSVTCSRGARE
jgi:glycosyltransferase involved in cell wall biosynthesis